MPSVRGVGLDIVDLERFGGVLERTAERFVERVFAPEERYSGSGGREAEHYAARFAAKEAFLKAIGTGLAHGIRWTDVVIVNGSDGEPVVRLEGRAAEIARDRGIETVWVSLTHSRQSAAAVVILEG